MFLNVTADSVLCNMHPNFVTFYHVYLNNYMILNILHFLSYFWLRFLLIKVVKYNILVCAYSDIYYGYHNY